MKIKLIWLELAWTANWVHWSRIWKWHAKISLLKKDSLEFNAGICDSYLIMRDNRAEGPARRNTDKQSIDLNP